MANSSLYQIVPRAESSFPLSKQVEIFLRTQSGRPRYSPEMLIRQDDGTLIFGVFRVFNLWFLPDWIARCLPPQVLIQCWRFATIYEPQFDFGGFSTRYSSFHFQHANPRTLVQFEILVRIRDALMSIFGYSFVGAPDRNRGNCVDDKNEKAKTFKPKGQPIYPIALSIAGYFGMIAAWLSIGLCRRWWTGGLCFLGMIGGFCVSVFGGLIALDRIVGVF
jgi:hypothetical protein